MILTAFKLALHDCNMSVLVFYFLVWYHFAWKISKFFNTPQKASQVLEESLMKDQSGRPYANFTILKQ